MSATGEVEQPTAEQPVVVEKPEAAEKPVKERKPKAAAKEKKAKTTKTAAHPPYFEMIKEALLALNEKNGSSPYAIAKYMEEKHKAVLPANFRKILGLQLKNSATKGKLIKVKASYKLSESGKTDKPAAAKPAAKKPTAPAADTKKPRTTRATAVGTKRKAEGVKKVATKKAGKKATPAKAKQPKSIKSPAAKKAKKASAA
ncbi:Histone H1 [Sesamum angolense]|uniref:Histone H1 n=1 Tax=Sesamum angolense TaxID=2727404 RepID=A0AAE1WI33_9LAMI|nr:Histone H1 [Sesamum angolense]